MTGITLNTFGDLLRYGYRLTGYCRQCGVHKDIDLTALPADRSYVGARFKCQVCAGRVEMTLSQIAATREGHLPALDRWRRR